MLRTGGSRAWVTFRWPQPWDAATFLLGGTGVSGVFPRAEIRRRWGLYRGSSRVRNRGRDRLCRFRGGRGRRYLRCLGSSIAVAFGLSRWCATDAADQSRRRLQRPGLRELQRSSRPRGVLKKAGPKRLPGLWEQPAVLRAEQRRDSHWRIRSLFPFRRIVLHCSNLAQRVAESLSVLEAICRIFRHRAHDDVAQWWRQLRVHFQRRLRNTLHCWFRIS